MVKNLFPIIIIIIENIDNGIKKVTQIQKEVTQGQIRNWLPPTKVYRNAGLVGFLYVMILFHVLKPRGEKKLGCHGNRTQVSKHDYQSWVARLRR